MEAQTIEKALETTGGHRGQAAVQLGISRRTLSRKLREYGLGSARPAAPIALGSLSDEERQAFRAEMKVPASIVTAEGQELTCIAANLSAGGIGLEGLPVVLSYQGGLRVRFRIPNSDRSVEVLARLAGLVSTVVQGSRSRMSVPRFARKWIVGCIRRWQRRAGLPSLSRRELTVNPVSFLRT